MNKNILVPIFSFLFLLSFPSAATTGKSAKESIEERPERAGGIYFAYPEDEITHGRLAPEVYEAFYVSHYGRHGSRYLISDNDYRRVADCLEMAAEADCLTPEGLRLKLLVDSVWKEARGRGGELTPLGSRQHRAIARRLASDYPTVFNDTTSAVTAASTPVMRCAHSMFAFIEGLKEKYPHLSVPRESSERNMYYLNYHSPESGPYASHKGPWYNDYLRFRNEHTHPDRLIAQIFKANVYSPEIGEALYECAPNDPDAFFEDLYWMAVDVQNGETDVDLLGFFTTEELYGLWQIANFKFYACNSSYPPAKGHHTANARNLVRNIVETAESYIAGNRRGASLRFGHDGNIIPLTALLRLDGCYSDATDPARLADGYANFRISPMASNLQLIFLKPAGKDATAENVLVRVMLNERDITLPVQAAVSGPDGGAHYRWTELVNYLRSLL